MTDRELIKAELQNLQKILEAKADMCIGNGKVKLLSFANACSGALELLKEQGPKQAIKQTCHVMIDGGYENPVVVTRYDWLCPTCKSLLCRDIDVIDDNYHFCKVCGQAVKWDEPPKEADNG